MRLQDYPRPALDNGWGLHDSASASYKRDKLDELAGWLHDELGIRWFKMLVDLGGPHKLDFLDALGGAGIVPVVRLYSYRPHPGVRLDSVTADAVREYVRHGVSYFELGNEPNHRLEWNDGDGDWNRNPELVAAQFTENARAINNLGGIHLVPACDTGGNFPTRLWWMRFLNELERIPVAYPLISPGEGSGLDILDRNAIAAHMRPDVHPPEYPYIWANQNDPDQLAKFGHYPTIHDDWTALRMDEMIDDLVVAKLGHSIPILGTEAGYGGGAPLCGDTRFPCVDIRLPYVGGVIPPQEPLSHADANVEMFRRYGRHYKPPLQIPGGKWLMPFDSGFRDARFCDCFWKGWGTEGEGWPDDNLLNNPAWGGGHAPLVEALKREPKFVRPPQAGEGGEKPMAYQFVLGFKALADQLGPDTVGEPQMSEASIPIGGNKMLAVQVTTKGMMVYVTGGQPLFLPKALP